MSFGNRLANNVNGLIMGIIMAVILLAVGVALGPTVISTAADINATALANVPLSSIIILLATYVGTFYYLALVLGMIGMVWATVKFSK